MIILSVFPCGLRIEASLAWRVPTAGIPARATAPRGPSRFRVIQRAYLVAATANMPIVLFVKCSCVLPFSNFADPTALTNGNQGRGLRLARRRCRTQPAIEARLPDSGVAGRYQRHFA